ncbi:hypothetical protein [Leptothoe sp. PORK10 BA2]|uniref:hypothetical protein n=1 Tax=Leptothoe sp. PORK10 BA2 TaxID=3110254 RepID=UPI002B207D43|nr:hypothetical protein [Leptothoe sp. PORK10 BA2]MEA5466850.1 hypothetical protein [Leptothoe sp. PORK10 BA2]
MQQSILKPILTTLTGLTISLGFAATAQANTVALKFDVSQPAQSIARATTNSTPPVALTFLPDDPAKPNHRPTINPTQPDPISDLFAGGTSSLVSKAVGSAEGTRTPTGGYTSAYYGHVDPGNGVWNLGSFSYQHGAASPEEADQKQLGRLQRQTLELRRQAQAHAFSLSRLEELNGIDLANQAPLAALDRGYINWLAVAKQQPMDSQSQIVWARTKAFLDPDTGYWDAPGLGNHWDAIYRDQQRRYDAILRALASH